MRRSEWQQALAAATTRPAPAFMCAETPWQRCHRRFIADLLTTRGHDVVHLVPPVRASPTGFRPGPKLATARSFCAV